MNAELIFKVVGSVVTGIGAILALFQFFIARRSQSYQNYKIELDLLSQCIEGEATGSEFRQFLLDVRREKISFVAFGMPIPNADLERVIRYYESGHATTHDIGKAWRYRNQKKRALSFELQGPFKAQLILIRIYAIFCLLLMVVTVAAALWFDLKSKELGVLGIMFAILFFIVTMVARGNEGLFTAARLAKLEKENASEPETTSRNG